MVADAIPRTMAAAAASLVKVSRTSGEVGLRGCGGEGEKGGMRDEG